uniref:Uncharacterized protein n=1 Tax=Helianthus annuus TaxID=4232 RepID=A0A251UQN9_HELAN
MYSSSFLLIQMIQASIIRSSPEFQPSLSSGFLISLSVKPLNQSDKVDEDSAKGEYVKEYIEVSNLTLSLENVGIDLLTGAVIYALSLENNERPKRRRRRAIVCRHFVYN